MDPLYPYVLGGLYRLFGRDLLVVRLIQVGMSVASCALVARLGTMLGGVPVGLGAGLWFALYKPEIMFTAEIQKTCLSILLTTAGLVLFLARSRASRFGAGVVLGLAALTRANLLLLAPLGALVPWREREPGTGGRSIIAPALFLAGFALALAPVAWRNHRVSGAWVLTTTQGGQNFYMGNNPGNSPARTEPSPSCARTRPSRRRTSAPRPSDARDAHSTRARRHASGTARRSASSASSRTPRSPCSRGSSPSCRTTSRSRTTRISTCSRATAG